MYKGKLKRKTSDNEKENLEDADIEVCYNTMLYCFIFMYSFRIN